MLPEEEEGENSQIWSQSFSNTTTTTIAMAGKKIRAMKTHMSETKDGKPVPLPISMIRSTPNSGTPIGVLEQGVDNAAAALDAVLATPEWTATGGFKGHGCCEGAACEVC